MELDKKIWEKLDETGKERYLKFAKYNRYILKPELWIAEQSPFTPAPYQLEIMEAAADWGTTVNNILVRSPRGGGKTFITSTIVAWFIDVHETLGIDWAVQTTAPSMDTLKTGLWKEIQRAVRLVENKTEATRYPNLLEMRGKYGLARSKTAPTNQAVNIEGMHAKRMLIVVDEAKGTRDEVWDSLRGSYSEAGAVDEHGNDKGNRAIVLAISTPGQKMGRFYDIATKHDKYPDWKRFHITQEAAIKAGRISQIECDKAKKHYGVDSALYRNHYLGEFHTDDTKSFMPPHWIDEAFKRYHKTAISDPGYLIAGIDPASTGQDLYVVAYYSPSLNGIVRVTEKKYVPDQVAQAREIIGTADEFIIDTHGDRSIKNIFESITDKPVHAFEGGHGTKWKTRTGQKVRNVRAAAFINLLQELDPAFGSTFFLPELDRIRSDIQMQTIKPTINGVVQLQPKDWLKKTHGVSPDYGDAISMAIWVPPAPPVTLAESYDTSGLW